MYVMGYTYTYMYVCSCTFIVPFVSVLLWLGIIDKNRKKLAEQRILEQIFRTKFAGPVGDPGNKKLTEISQNVACLQDEEGIL
jgi:hypothetical protein